MMNKVAIVMGSKSDWETLGIASELLTEFDVGWHAEVVSAHRTPEKLFSFGRNARANGLEVIIAGAGGGCTFARDGGGTHSFASTWRANTKQSVKWHGQFVVDCADAQRCCSWNVSNRDCRRF